MNKIRKYGLTIVAALLLTVFASVAAWAAGEGAALQAGGDRLVAKQCLDGGWGWPLDCSGLTSPNNTIGPIGMGLAQAYKFSGDPAMQSALLTTGTKLLLKFTNFSPSDGYLAVQLDRIFGGTTYRDHVWNNFYAPLAAGTYNKNGAGTLYDTAGYVALVISSRGASQANLATWDIGMGLVAAASMGASTTEWINGLHTTIDTLSYANTDYYWETIGLTGAVYGLAFVGADYTATAGDYAGMNLAGMANALAGYQMSTGGISWDAQDITTVGNEDTQATAYAILALNEVSRAVHSQAIAAASTWLVSAQLGTGGWDVWGENNELTGEALWAMSVAASSVMGDSIGLMDTTGIAGSQGPTGPQGPAGADGAQGPTGADGATGATGAQGPIGLQGPAGAAGATGAQGAGTTSWTDGSRMVGTSMMVGAGITTPAYNLDVTSSGAMKSSLHFSKDGNDVGGWLTSVLDNNFFVSSGCMYDGSQGGWIQKSSDGVCSIAGSSQAGYEIWMGSGCTVGATCTVGYTVTATPNGNLGIGIRTPTQKLEVNGGVRLNTTTSRPICNATIRGTFWVAQGASGVKDTVQVCAKDASNIYAWRTLY